MKLNLLCSFKKISALYRNKNGLFAFSTKVIKSILLNSFKQSNSFVPLF